MHFLDAHSFSGRMHTREINVLTHAEASKYKQREFDVGKRGRRGGDEKGEEEYNQLFVTVSGLSRSIISRKVLLTALIFRPFLLFSCFYPRSLPSHFFSLFHLIPFSVFVSRYMLQNVCARCFFYNR